MKHYEFSPSRLYTYSICPGKYYMEQGIPEPEESPDSERGTNLHAVALEGKKDFKISVYDEMQIEWIKEREQEQINQYGTPIKVLTEHFLTYSDKDGIVTEGYLDKILLYDNFGIVIDDKFGYKKVNKVSENVQIGSYAMLLAKNFDLPKVKGIILQPPICFSSNYTFAKFDNIIDNIKEIKSNALGCVKTNTPILTPSEPACRFCKARMFCPAARNKYLDDANELAEKLETVAPNIPDELVAEGLDIQRDHKKFWQDWNILAKKRVLEYAEVGQKLGGRYGIQYRENIDKVNEFGLKSEFLNEESWGHYDKLDTVKLRDTKIREYAKENKVTLKEARTIILEKFKKYVTYKISSQIK